MSINIAIISGRVSQNQDFRTSANNKQIASFSIAMNKTMIKNELKSETTWFRIIVSSERLIEVVRFLSSGSYVTVGGMLRLPNAPEGENMVRGTDKSTKPTSTTCQPKD